MLVDTYDKLSKKLLQEKKEKFKEFVERTMADFGIYDMKIRFWKTRCPSDSGREIAHIHLDEDPPIICISLHTLSWLPMEEVEDTAIHEVSHVRNPEHDSVLYITIDEIMQKHWRPPMGGRVVNGTGWTEKRAKVSKPSPSKKECNYYFCHEKKGLKPCKLCKELYCKEHLRAKPAGMPRFRRVTKEDKAFMEEWRKNGHPCLEYYTQEEESEIEYNRDVYDSDEYNKLVEKYKLVPDADLKMKEREKRWQENMRKKQLKKRAKDKGIPDYWIEEAPEKKLPKPSYWRDEVEPLPVKKKKTTTWERIKRLFGK